MLDLGRTLTKLFVPLGAALALQLASRHVATDPGDTVDLEDGEAPPFRHHVEKRVRVGLVVGGLATTIASHVAFLTMVGLQSEDPDAIAYVPIAGPIAATADRAGMAPFAVLEIGGLAMAAAGLLFQKRVAAPDRLGLADPRLERLAVVPAIDPMRGDIGLRAASSF